MDEIKYTKYVTHFDKIKTTCKFLKIPYNFNKILFSSNNFFPNRKPNSIVPATFFFKFCINILKHRKKIYLDLNTSNFIKKSVNIYNFTALS